MNEDGVFDTPKFFLPEACHQATDNTRQATLNSPATHSPDITISWFHEVPAGIPGAPQIWHFH